MKYLFPGLCWAVVVGGVLGACARRPIPPAPEPVPTTPYQQEAVVMPDPNETILPLAAPEFTLFFEFNSSALREAYKASALAQYLKETGVGVHLMGHASAEGTREYNQHLGAYRAQAVREFLEAAGIPSYRITWESFGEDRPANTDPNHLELNRRVEARIEGVAK
jgi:outer membrane protein OmpA-like peptidoglycan-associated protein